MILRKMVEEYVNEVHELFPENIDYIEDDGDGSLVVKMVDYIVTGKQIGRAHV